MKKNGFSHQAYLWLVTVLAVVAVVVVNLALERLDERAYLRLDLSPDSVSEVSQKTKTILSSLNEDVTVTVVRRTGAESALGSFIDELLGKYQALSGHIKAQYVDPEAAPYLIAKLNPSGREVEENTVFLSNANQSRIRRVDADQMTYQRTLDGEVYSLFCGDARFCGTMEILLSDQVRNAYFLTGHDEIPLESCSRFALSLGAMGLSCQELRLSVTQPSSSDLIVILSPKTDVSGQEAKALARFLDGGGQLLIAYDADTPQDKLSSLAQVLDLYGLGFETGKTVESIDSKDGYLDYPDWLCPALASENDVTSSVTGRIVMQNACAVSAPRLVATLTTTPLLETSQQAYRKLTAGDLYAFEKGDASGRQLLALLLEQNSGSLRIAQLGSTVLFLDDAALGGSNLMDASANLDFLTALVSRLRGEETIAASAELKVIPSNLIAFPSDREQQRVMALAIGLLPALILVTGLTVLLIRRRRVR